MLQPSPASKARMEDINVPGFITVTGLQGKIFSLRGLLDSFIGVTSIGGVAGDLDSKRVLIWNQELISTHLWEVDKQRILQIPVGTATSRDRLIWHYSKNGAFSVASCYHMIFADTTIASPELPRDEGSGSNSHQINWTLVWRLKVPPKVRMFIWRATLNVLPHRAELFRRKISQTQDFLKILNNNFISI